MYLHQKLGYKYRHLESAVDVTQVLKSTERVLDFVYFDTETTGLNIITDKPFLLAFGWSSAGDKQVFTADWNCFNFFFMLRFLNLFNFLLFFFNKFITCCCLHK